MKIFGPRFAISAAVLLAAFLTAHVASAEPGKAAAPSEADHVVTTSEIESRLDQKVRSDEADRQAIRDLLARPEVRRVAGSAGLSLERANAAVATLSGPELTRLAERARQAGSAIGGSRTVTMTWTTVIIVVVALVVLITVL